MSETKEKLLEAKVLELEAKIKKLKDKKKYGLVWEDKPEEVVTLCKTNIPVLKEVKSREVITNENKPVNILIEGDNYHSLSVLNYTHRNKIDVIYIDPPYNTGAKDWKYNNDYVDINDTYRHSHWLSMMKNRLAISKSLLKDDGVLICAIDENEDAHLGVLLEEIFNGYEIHKITVVHNPRGIQGTNFSYTNDFLYFVFKEGKKIIGNRKIKKEDIDWRNLRDNGGESLRTDARNCFYPIITDGKKIIGFGEVEKDGFHPKNRVIKKGKQYFIYPIDKSGIERKWRYARQSVDSIRHLLRIKESKGGFEVEIGKDFGSVRTVWIDSRYDANENGTKLISEILNDDKFDFPKSLYAVIDSIEPIISERKNAIVLDFFAGSGTTGHAVMDINKDGGNRQFILCTNNENKICEEVTYKRIKGVIKGYKKKSGEKVEGLGGNLKYYKATLIPKSYNRDEMKIRITEECTEMLCIREGVYGEIKNKSAYKIFRQGDKIMAVYYFLSQKELINLKKDLDKMTGEKILYCFTLDPLGLNEKDFDDWRDVRLEPIPQKILDIYQEINEY